MRIAIPVSGEQFCEHFGRGDGFFVCEVDESTRAMERPRVLTRPRSKCESLPQWLQELRVNVVLVGGIGAVGQRHLEERGIRVYAGHSGQDPLRIVHAFLAGNAGGENPCATFEHRHHHCRKPGQ